MRIFLFTLILTAFTGIIVSAEEVVRLLPYTRELTFTGFTRPAQKMTLSSEISGKCMAVPVDVGDTVDASGVVGEIDSTFVRLDLEKNRIAQEKTRKQLELEDKTLARYTSLIKKNSTAQATYDEALNNTHILRLALQDLQAEQSRLKELLARHTLRAPQGWRVIERYVEPGEYLRQGDPVFLLGDFNTLVVPFLFTYEELSILEDMAEIKLYLTDLQQKVEAEIFRVTPDFDEKRKKIHTELITRQVQQTASHQWRGGLRALLTMSGKREKDTYIVPFTALINRYDAHWLITEDGQRKKVLLLGTIDSNNNAIITGKDLSAAEKVLASPESAFTNQPNVAPE